MRGLIWTVLHEPLLASAFLALCSIAGLILATLAEWTPSPRERRLLEEIREALRKRGQLKAGAVDLDVRPERISRWLNPTQPNILTRLANLGDAFWREWISVRAEALGLRVVDARLAAALDLVDAHQRRMLRARMKETA